jgi:16S rRNA (guanine966-N2)-methyltransferase
VATAIPVPGARVLDLFAGTGALGLEALSRGAARVAFVDDGTAARALLRANIEKMQAMGVTDVWRRDATRLGPNRGAPYTLVFLDPPYGKALGEAALASALRRRLAGPRRDGGLGGRHAAPAARGLHPARPAQIRRHLVTLLKAPA